MTHTPEEYKYFAFISYSSHDTKWGWKLQRKLEGYKMSATLCHQHGWKRKPINPVFFAPTEIQPGELTEELKMRLRMSRNLIVVCSPHSARSKWVGEEIAYFHSLGREKNIYFFIIDGIPNSGNEDTECFHPITKKLRMPESLGVNIHEKVHRLPWLNEERAFVQLITKLLGIGFDDIWQRHKRLLVRHAILWAVGGAMVIAAILGTWWINKEIDINMNMVEESECNVHLPQPGNVIVNLILENEMKPDTLENLNEQALFVNIPRRFLGKKVRVTATCCNFLPLDTTFMLTQNATIGIRRNPSVYGDVKARVYKSTHDGLIALPNQSISVANHCVTSDQKGGVKVHIPLKEQRTKYHITAAVPLETDSITMPCGNYEAIIVK